MLLAAEGYILSRPQSGYYVTEILNSGPREAWKPGGKETDGPKTVSYTHLRLDVLLVKKGLAESREKAKAIIK